MKSETVPIDSVRPDPANARRHGERNIGAIVESLKRFGQQKPIVVGADGVIVAGSGMHAAAKVLGWSEVAVVRSLLTGKDATAYAIADNRTAELAEWDLEVLAAQWRDLDAELQTASGFDEAEFLSLMNDLGNKGLTDPDDVPEAPDAATTVRGDIWVLGNHRLMCGDSAKAEDVDRLLEGAPVHLVNMDPPYNVAVEPRSANAIAAGNSSFESGQKMHLQKYDRERGAYNGPTHAKLRPKDRQLHNDALKPEEFAAVLDEWFGNASRVLLPGRGFYIWGGYSNHRNYREALDKTELYFSQCIVWWKDSRVLGRKDFMSDHEWVYYGWKSGAAHEFFGPNNVGDVWQVQKLHSSKMVHLCLHPEAPVLTEAGFRPIRSIEVGDRVFSGDGTFHRVEHVSTHPYSSEHLYRIVAKGGNAAVDASDNHPFLIWRPRKRGRSIVGGDVAWVRADEVRAGDYTMTPVMEESAADPFPEMGEEDWFLFGLYLAQGHLQRAGHGDRRYPVFSIHKRRQDLADRIWRRWPRTSEYDPNDYRSGAEQPHSGTTVMAFDGDAGERFEALGGRLSHGKHLAPECFALPRSKRAAILNGWLNGDGCRVHDRAYWQGNTVSGDLAAHLCLLAESVGYRTNLFSYDPPDDGAGIGGRAFKSRRRVHYLYFYEQGRLAKRGSPLRLDHDGRTYSLRQVKSVDRVKYEGDVWNLSVEGHPTFQTAVGLSHNTEKPVELARRALEYSSRPGENVLDLFGGSGSTLIACEMTGRRAFLMELDELYCDVICDRWCKFTGKEAIRVDPQGSVVGRKQPATAIA